MNDVDDNSSETNSIEQIRANNNRSSRAFIPLIFAALFMVTGICVLLFIGREKARIIGQSITELDIHPLLNTDKAITPETLAGKVVVLHFWNYRSKICSEGFPDIIKIQRQFHDDPTVLFLSVSCPEKEDDTMDRKIFGTKKFMVSHDASDLEAYYDPSEYSRSELSKLLTSGGFVYPTTLVLDGASKVVDVWRSPVTAKVLERTIEKAKRATGASK